ncbi:methyl-accepting chemotaxis protein [Kordiimonas marina]|uniref:methyl-accepting chemotaxis protein n=1 Tax=Kordiimonas marina TaxID=2872312 RepID=UPI001FF12336|nr:methyl-accepting chemotaxis protein [Kordiimonas marina]MCJ9427721.1 hypothetical protein [Kordiimonas marina]
MLKFFRGNGADGAVQAAISKQDRETTDQHNLEKLLLETMPVNIILCEPITGIISYANAASKRTLRDLEQYLPIKADEIVGQTIDIFHKKPTHQRRMIADPTNLPHTAVIQLGPEFLELNVNAVVDEHGAYRRALLCWTRVTEREKFRNQSASLKQMVDKMSINAMMCDPETLEITYMNDASRATLKRLQQYLPVDVDNIMGQCIDVFHKHPEHQRRILRDPANLPYQAKIKLGPESLRLDITAIMADDGSYLGALATWDVVTNQVHVENMVSQSAMEVTGETRSLAEQATMMATVAEQNIGIAAKVAEDSTTATDHVQAVASATEELSSSIVQIAQQVAHASAISAKATERTELANKVGVELTEASNQISQVVQLINDIADQTNLLALNATIEAARAGEAGKGFAVVASEVKSLANQTAKATDDIARQVASIQDRTERMVTSLSEIGSIINEVNTIATEIDGSTSQQGEATQEISRSVDQAAQRTRDVSASMEEMRKASERAAESARAVQISSDRLTSVATTMHDEVRNLLK